MIIRILPALLLAVLWCASCDEVQLVETPVLLAFPFEGDFFNCANPAWYELGQPDVPPPGMDIFLIDVMAYHGPTAAGGALPSACQACLTPSDGEEGPSCELLSRRCLCGGPRTTIFGLEEAMAEVRVSDVPTGQPICVRVVGLASQGQPRGPASGPAPDCPAELAECSVDRAESVAQRTRLCVLSDLAVVGDGKIPILLRDIHCRNLDAIIRPCQSPDSPQLICDTAGVVCEATPGFCDWGESFRGPLTFPTATCAGPLAN